MLGWDRRSKDDDDNDDDDGDDDDDVDEMWKWEKVCNTCTHGVKKFGQ